MNKVALTHLITLSCLPAALACYVASFETGAEFLLVGGVLAELMFWSRFLVRRPTRQ